MSVPASNAATALRMETGSLTAVSSRITNGAVDKKDIDFAAGASAYVTKPMPLRELRDIVDKAVLERRPSTDLNQGSTR